MQWVNSTEPGHKPNAKTVFVRSAMGSIYRSFDDGMNWVSQRDKMAGDYEEPYKTRIQQMLFSKADARYAVMRGYGEANWFTKDQGDSYYRSEFGVIADMKLHPKNPEWLLSSQYQGSFPNRYLSLFLSTDFGRSWKKIASNIYQFEWADPTIKGFTEKTIMACIRKSDASPKTTFMDWDPNIDFVRTHDFFETSEIVIAHGNRFAIHSPYWFVAAMNPQEELEVKLHVSADQGRVFQRALFPYQLSERSYRVVDSKEESVFVQVSHGTRDSSSANVYMSGAKGHSYTLSLRSVVKDYRGLSDFEHINGVDGVYIANVIDASEQGAEAALLGGLSSLLMGAGAEGAEDLKPPTRSKISFDKGAMWSDLKPPQKDSQGRVLQCDDCALHLNGKTAGYLGPVYSSASSTGLIMATGNVGHHLHARQDETNTYFSRDAGRTWEEIRKGSYIYEFGDHGALMVMANNREATNRILYSWNEGLNWTEFQFWEHHIEVENIITEPSGTSQVFIVYGRRNDKGVLMQLNFETLHERRCSGINAAGADASDYEMWTPADELRAGGCLLGRKVTFTRRKRAVQCFNGWDYDRKEDSRNCVCERTDYECDFGYQVNEQNTCERVPDMPMAGYGAPSDCAGFFTVSRGYRKVPGDSCVGGDAETRLEPLRLSCPGFGRTGMVLVGVTLGLGAVFALFTYQRRKEMGFADPWRSTGDCLDFVRGGSSYGPAMFGGFGAYGQAQYTGLVDTGDLEDDDFGLGEDDDEAQVLGESLHEYALGISSDGGGGSGGGGGGGGGGGAAASPSGGQVPDLISIDSPAPAASSPSLPPRPTAAPPLPTAPLPSIAPPPPAPNRK